MKKPHVRNWVNTPSGFRLGIFALVVLMLSGCFWYVYRMRGLEEAVLITLVGFTVEFSSALFAVMIGLSQIESRMQAVARDASLGALRQFWSVPRPAKEWVILFGGRIAHSTTDPELRISYATVYAFSQVDQMIKHIHGPHTEVRLVNIRNIQDWGEVLHSNLIVLGGIVTVPFVGALLEHLQMPARQEVTDSDVRRIHVHELFGMQDTIFQTQFTGNFVTEDHAIVLRVINSATGSAIFVFSGGWGAGTVAGVLATTTRELFNVVGFNPELEANQTVVSVDNIRNGMLQRGHPTILCRPWTARHVEESKMREIMERVASREQQDTQGHA
jgi:hypothetical protein